MRQWIGNGIRARQTLSTNRPRRRAPAGRDVLGIERLEDRRLLSVSVADAWGYEVESRTLQGELLIAGAAGVTATLSGADEGAVPINLQGNTFNFYGQTYNGNSAAGSLYVSSNGMLTFGGANTEFTNDPFGPYAMEETAIAEAAIAPLWDDWLAPTINEGVLYKFESGRLTVQWTMIQHYPGTPSGVTFQAVLQLNTGDKPGAITFNYFDLTTEDVRFEDGFSATVGIKAATPQGGEPPASFLLVSYNSMLNDWVRAGKSIHIRPNEAPVFESIGPLTVNEGSTATLTAFASDVDVKDVLKYSWDLNNDGIFEVLDSATASFSAVGRDGTSNSTQPIRVRVDDGRGHVVVIERPITIANVAPVVSAETFGLIEDGSVGGNVLTNDSDPANVGATAPLDTLTAVLGRSPAHGVVSLNSNGVFSYVPTGNYFGEDSFTYVVTDGDGGVSAETTVTLNITEVNDTPVAVADAAAVDEDGTVTIDLLANDTDADLADGVAGNDAANVLAVEILTNPANGSVTRNADGTFTYTPAANYFGGDSFKYQITDGRGGNSQTATVSVTVKSVNDAPVATGESYVVDEDGTLNVPAAGLLANDTDVERSALSAVLAGGPSHGTVVINADGSFSYTPDANFHGVDQFSYVAHDGTDSSAPTVVTINVAAVNDAPVAAGEAYAVDEDGTLDVPAGGVLSNDTDVEGSALSAVVVDGPAHGNLVLNGDGSFTYTPDANFHGADQFSYRAHDGADASEPTVVTINVAAVNDAPTAGNDALVLMEDATLSITAGDLLGNDEDVDGDALKVEVLAHPRYGVLTPNADGTFSYAPDHDFVGDVTFTYRVSDGVTTSESATVTLTVLNVNDAPVANNDTATTTDQAAVEGFVLLNDTDVDGDTLTARQLSSPQGGTLVFGSDGKFTYTPRAGFSGTDSFSYAVSDGRGGSSEGTVTITVTSEPVVEGTVQLVEDATQPGRMALVVNGTSNSEFIAIVHAFNGVEVFIGCESRGVFQPTGRLIVYANGGNDVVLIGPGVQQAAWVYGDDGNDIVKLGHGGGIAFGGAGNDLVSGGNGRDVLVGGEGADLLVGNPGDDILVAAFTVYDNRTANAVHEDAWSHIHAEWNSARTFEERVASLRGGGGGLNDSYFLNDATVEDDMASNCIDILTGSSGRDWYVYKFGEDKVIGLSSTEATYDVGIA